MSNKYLYDDYGNKYEGMTKEEILESIGAGVLRENVFTGSITYNSNPISYSYTGAKPDNAVLLKLLTFGCDPTTYNLTASEVSSYLGLTNFAIIFYCVDTELYVTNANKNYLSFVKAGIGEYKAYPNGTKYIGYYVKTNEVVNNLDEKIETEVNTAVAKAVGEKLKIYHPANHDTGGYFSAADTDHYRVEYCFRTNGEVTKSRNIQLVLPDLGDTKLKLGITLINYSCTPSQATSNIIYLDQSCMPITQYLTELTFTGESTTETLTYKNRINSSLDINISALRTDNGDGTCYFMLAINYTEGLHINHDVYVDINIEVS